MSIKKKGFLFLVVSTICLWFVGCGKQEMASETVELAQSAMKNYTIQSEILEDGMMKPEVPL